MNIVKRNSFYYLAHSFRKGGKVVHREKYLGKQVPDDIEKLKEAFLTKCLAEEAFKKLNRIKKNFANEWRSYPESIKQKILTDFAIDFTYNTNAIEGSTLTLEDTEELIRHKMTPNRPLSDVQETLNHARTFFEVFNEKNNITAGMLLNWHMSVFKDTKPDIAGRFREYLVRVGDYIAPDWQDVPALISQFFEFYDKSKKAMHAVELAARAHYKFEKIHPFGDGNGRIGRLIIAYTLKKMGYPMLIIEYKKRKAYYHALSKTENDFLAYFIRAYFSAHKKYL
ncbi:MAG TPA: Fic family protein [Candidatus Nanoarchaeia archaeon]|nr:Fic family protein [Candidatus Nanoarchaeia archaeon]